MGNQPLAPQAPAGGQVPAAGGPQAAPQPAPAPAAPGSPPAEFPYQPHQTLAAVLLGSALLIIFGTGAWFLYEGTWTPKGYTGGGAAAAAGVLIVLALILHSPSLIMDDTPAAGGEPSTMRVMGLAIVLTFCVIMLRTAWNSGALPSLENQGNWVWLVTAALGGKALQKYSEVQEKLGGKK